MKDYQKICVLSRCMAKKTGGRRSVRKKCEAKKYPLSNTQDLLYDNNSMVIIY